MNVCLGMFVYLNFCLSGNVSVWILLSLCLFGCVSGCTYISPDICMVVWISVLIYVCLYVYLDVLVAGCLDIHLYVLMS